MSEIGAKRVAETKEQILGFMSVKAQNEMMLIK